ncbi:MAG: hypothetical protein MHM6MM_002444 [Cercozoa sp. M6MM]
MARGMARRKPQAARAQQAPEEDTPGIKLPPTHVMMLSVGFITCVLMLHIYAKLRRVVTAEE